MLTGPNIRDTGKPLFSRFESIRQCTAMGDYGIDKENQKAINQLSGSERIEYGYLKDMLKIKRSRADAIMHFLNSDEISKMN
ncbi:MAG: hypothetical protein ACLSBH_11850 [Coprobacillus cateniformis]